MEGYGEIRRGLAVVVDDSRFVGLEHTDVGFVTAGDHTYRVIIGRTDFNEFTCDHCPGSRAELIIVRDDGADG